MKQIMMPIQPQWVAKILSGEKTSEIRKSAPKEWADFLKGKTKKKPEPMIVNIYCTKSKPYLSYIAGKVYAQTDSTGRGPSGICFNGKVVAKFTLKEIEKIEWDGNWEDPYFYTKTKEQEELLENACIDDLEPYMRGCEGYDWHISNLEIFDEPKELSEFYFTKKYKSCYECPHYDYDLRWYCETCEEQVPLERAPQSWCYVEERE